MEFRRVLFRSVIYRAKKLGVNPYTHEVFKGTRDYEQAMLREENAA